MSTGSLVQGLAAANGMAIAKRLNGIAVRIFGLMGDGERSEGAVWEAAQLAVDKRLDGAAAIVDANGLAQSGPAPYAHDTSVIAGRFRAFGWKALEIDGHDFGKILRALEQTRDSEPTAIVATTIKGKGVSFLEGATGWHDKALDAAECVQALREIAPADQGVEVDTRFLSPSTARSSPPLALPTRVDYVVDDQVAMRTAFRSALTKLGMHFPDRVVLDRDVKNSTKTDRFADEYPWRFIPA
ncbi:thiamine pyrophosphate-dependent enzyme [Thiorhodococcus minor]|uniref:thiamine pyrophosphate-dependent enzyme n=1 Tax=Thiorhodococcus minor TaxID=57489 RepID=UPI003158F2B3